MHRLTPHQASSPPSNGGTGSFSLNPYGLATLAAELMPRQAGSPPQAVETAYSLFEAGRLKLDGERLRAEWPAEADRRYKERLASIHVNYDKGVRFITGRQRWDFALAAFKKFVAWRAGNDEASAGSYAASHSFLTTLWRLSSAIRGGRQQ
jgi:hypothetical protein